MHEDGSIRLEIIERLVERFVALGLSGVFVCGTTGEGLALTLEERRQVAERWIQAAADRLRVIVHVGHTSFREAKGLAEAAREAGAHAVACLPPVYYRPADVESLIEFLRPVARGAGDLPFYYYHIPMMSGVDLPMRELLEQGSERISNLRGVKYSHTDLMDYRQCVELDGGRFDVLFSRDELLLAGLALGARAGVGSTYNYSAPIYQKLLEAFRSGDLEQARACADLGIAVLRIVNECGGVVAAGKALMGLLGFECGPPRPPLRRLGRDEVRKLETRLEEDGLLETLEGKGP